MTWQEFEKLCINYLNAEYGTKDIIFTGIGGSDSTEPDIKVVKNSQLLFNIEVKMPDAQSGQFVVLNKNNKFIFSDSNKSYEDEFSDSIIEYMNKNYNSFASDSNSSKDIDLDSSIFAQWIISSYRNKGIKFVITGDKNNFIIFPIDQYDQYFSIKCVFRPKYSGSSKLPNIRKQEVENLFTYLYGPCKVIDGDKGKKYLKTKYNLEDKTKIQGSKYRFQFNKKFEDKYEIRQLANTRNRTVIFSISLKKSQDQNDLEKFLEEIK